MTEAFNTAWNLTKESVSPREYRNMWTNTRPSAGTGRYRIRGPDSRLKTGPMPQDISVERDADRLTGVGGISRESTLSYSKLHPANISEAMTTGDYDEGTWGWEREMIDGLARVSAHESTHQAIHDIEPSLRHDMMAHEYGAFAGEFAQDEYNPLWRLKHIREHPYLQNDHIDFFGNRSNNLLRQRAIQDIITRLRKYKSSEVGAFMGRRARMNALRRLVKAEDVRIGGRGMRSPGGRGQGGNLTDGRQIGVEDRRCVRTNCDRKISTNAWFQGARQCATCLRVYGSL